MGVTFILISCTQNSKVLNFERTPEGVLKRLKEGNDRFLEGKTLAPNRTEERRLETQKKQEPFAVVITCSDSRISPTLAFDTGIGDLFIIRTAGNIVSEIELASIEYAVEYLKTPLIMIMGHTDCGAIKAFVNHANVEGHIKSIMDTLENEPEEKLVFKTCKSDTLQNCTLANINHQAKLIMQNSEIIKKKMQEKKLMVVEAEYDHVSGKVNILKTYL